jgi:hypothetical protein
MRVLILPLVIVLSFCSIKSFSQGTCAAAYTLDVSIPFCQNYVMGALGTGTGFSPATGVGCNYLTNKRVTWFTFVPATNIVAANFIISLDVAATNMQATFYDPGATGCAAVVVNTPNATLCAPTGTGTLSPTSILFAGRPYFIRVYANINDNVQHFVNICYTPITINTIPVNGTCNIFPVGDPGTGPGFSPLPTGMGNRCGGAAGWDNDRRVTWFKFTPGSTLTCATFNINVDAAVKTEIAFYNSAGTYLNTSTLCMPLGSGIWAPALPATLTMGQTYYLRVYTNINDAAAHNINICASPYVQPNDLCSSATRIDNGGILDNNVCATGSGASSPPYEPGWVTSNSQNLLCAPVLQNTAWYYFTVKDNTKTTTVNVSGINCSNYGGGDLSGGTAGIQMGILQGDPTKTCTQTSGMIVPPTSMGAHCFQTTATSFSFAVTPGPSVANGTKMYIAVDGYNGANCSYVLSTINAIPIPVRLRYFTVWKQAQSNQLRWITSWETNNRSFDIERSFDGKEFSVIGSVPGTGTSTSDVQYKFDDYEIPTIAYYRLKQIDIDGKYEYSNVIVIKRDNIKSLFGLSFANPVHNNTVVTLSTETAGTTMLRVIDVAGREISAQVVECTRGNNTLVKDFSRLSGGTYYLIATQGENRIVKQFIKQ